MRIRCRCRRRSRPRACMASIRKALPSARPHRRTERLRTNDHLCSLHRHLGLVHQPGPVRAIALLIGLGFCGVLLISLGFTAVGAINSPPEATAEHEFHLEPKELKLASDGPFGKFDRAQLQRGLQVYTEVCAACHGLNLVSFRDLAALGYNEGRDQGDRRVGQFLEDRGPDDQSRYRRSGDPQGDPGRPFPGALSQRNRGARGQPQRASARPVADRQGARRWRCLHLFAADRISEAAGRICSSTSRPRRLPKGSTTIPISPI